MERKKDIYKFNASGICVANNCTKRLCKHINKLIKSSLPQIGAKLHSIYINHNQHTGEIIVQIKAEVPTHEYGITHTEFFTIEAIIRNIINSCACEELAMNYRKKINTEISQYVENII